MIKEIIIGKWKGFHSKERKKEKQKKHCNNETVLQSNDYQSHGPPHCETINPSNK